MFLLQLNKAGWEGSTHDRMAGAALERVGAIEGRVGGGKKKPVSVFMLLPDLQGRNLERDENSTSGPVNLPSGM